MIDAFHPIIRDWFTKRYGSPTPIQAEAWPRIVAGEHVLITAPTGSGKTLTAFLAALDAIVSGRWPTGETSVLYISPLKALNNDIQRNLLSPLAELEAIAHQRGEAFPVISVATRSGDTPARDRQQMLKHPPEILITTPESLNIMLSSPRARSITASIRTVILDEIHAVVGSKRGTHLMTAVERLALWAGEFQRIVVSATVMPLESVAAFAGGFEPVGDPPHPVAHPAAPGSPPPAAHEHTLRARHVTIVRAKDEKSIDLRVDFPETGASAEAADDAAGSQAGFWPALVRDLRAIVEQNRSTLIFVSTRRHAEKITLLLNEGLETPLAYAHHGSLSRELRLFVEQALKEGALRAIVATSSLELGIDIGALDEVIMVQTPGAVSSTLQRIGRSGHRVGETSRGVIYPIHGRDMVDAAAMAEATIERDIEKVNPVRGALDVLAQVLVSMTAMDRWHVDELYSAIRMSWPYHDLERSFFDIVLEMLAGRYAETRIRELRPRISIDRVSGEVSARDGVTALLYQSGGTIPDRGAYGMRLEGGGAVGELDEEFVWERRVGETFVFGSQSWTITSITDRDVIVVPAAPGVTAIPFWRAESRGRDAHYSIRLLDYLERADRAIADDKLDAFLGAQPALTTHLRESLAEVLHSQRDTTGCALPHRHHIVVELVAGGLRARGDDTVQEIVVHCGWGGRVNEPLALALAALWEREYGYPLEVFAGDDSLVLLLPNEFRVEEAFGSARCRELTRRGAVEALLRERLERSGRFGSLFRENAGRALLLPRGGFNRRMPLWLNRLRSKKLLLATAGLEDFPILLETWRNCLHDEFDLPTLDTLLGEIATGEIAISSIQTQHPSPFAAGVTWQQINVQMYQDDSLPSAARSSLSDELIRDAIRSEALRPRIPAAIAAEVELRMRRLVPGYTIEGASELLDWITERLALDVAELSALREAVVRDHGVDAWSIAPLHDRFIWIHSNGTWLFATRNRLPSLAALYPGAAAFEPADEWWTPPLGADGVPVAGLTGEELPERELALLELLRFRAPFPIEGGNRSVGLDESTWRETLSSLHEADLVVLGTITEDSSEPEVCDADVLEYLLRVRRSAARPHFDPVPASSLVPLWAQTTRLSSGRSDPDALVECLEQLFGFPAPAAAWEADIIPARLDDYFPLWLDGLFGEGELIWLGAGEERLTFCLDADVDLYLDAPTEEPSLAVATLRTDGGADFQTLRDRTGLSSEELAPALWSAAWRSEVSNEGFQSVRRGIETRFGSLTQTHGHETEDRGSRWRSHRGGRRPTGARFVQGTWFAFDAPDEPDPIARTEQDRDRARILLRRYGIVFREIVQREGGAFAWQPIFRALRLMELAGEVVSGLFVTGVGAPQFALRSTLELLERAAASDAFFWMNAVDPASPCGLSLGAHYDELPSRITANHLAFRGTRLLMTSRRGGRDLTFRVDPDDPDAPLALAPLRAQVARRWSPAPRVIVETVNGMPVRESPYAPMLRRAGFRDEFKTYVLSASYR